MNDSIMMVFDKYHLIAAFAVIGLTMFLAHWASKRLTRGRLHGSVIAILVGLALALALAWIGGVSTWGIVLFAGVLVSFVASAVVAMRVGYTRAVNITTIAAGAVAHIVGTVTGAMLGAISEVIALSSLRPPMPALFPTAQ